VGFGIKTLSSGIGGAKKLVHKTLAYPAFLLSGLTFRHIRPDTRESTVLIMRTLVFKWQKVSCFVENVNLRRNISVEDL
jgi:hypothetical protein